MTHRPTPSHPTIAQQSWQWKLALFYDVLMMFLIVCNLLTLGIQAAIHSDFGATAAQFFHLITERSRFIHSVSPIIRQIDFYFINYLIAELVVRWLMAIVTRRYARWWFFPFVHWYEVLAIIPMLRFLRLLRAAVIGYRLYQLGYQIIPRKWLKSGLFYYDVVMEEITDRVILTTLKQIEKELDASQTMHGILHHIVDHHRQMLANAVADSLQTTLPPLVQRHQTAISHYIGQAVADSIAQTPDLHQLLRLIPLVGGRIEQHIQGIAQDLGERLTLQLLAPLKQNTSDNQIANPLITQLSQEISGASLDSPYLEQLVESLIRESLQGIRQQVKIQQWKVALDKQHLNS